MSNEDEGQLAEFGQWLSARVAATQAEMADLERRGLVRAPGPLARLCQGALWGPRGIPAGRERGESCQPLGKGHISARDPGEARLIGVHDHRRRRIVNEITILPGGLVGQAMRGGSGCIPRGLRGVVRGFSKGSRRRLRRRLMEVDYEVVDISYMTSTYHNEWGDWPSWKRDLRRFRGRLVRRFRDALLGGLWRLQFQQRQAPHFHLLIFWKKGKRPQEEVVEQWCKRAWADVIGTVGDVPAEKYGTKVIEVGPRKGELGPLLGYLMGDMARASQDCLRDPDTGDPLPTGRVWGVFGRVPFSAGIVLALTQAAWNEVVARVNRLGAKLGVWYYSAIGANWAGWTIMGAPQEVAPLLAGVASGG